LTSARTNTAAKVNIEFGEYSIPVYTLEMIAIEKLRATCQQMPEYGIRGAATQRARDFYDIHLIVTSEELISARRRITH